MLDQLGIKRALENWPAIDFTHDRDGCLFTATVHRLEIEGALASTIRSEERPGKGSEKILALLKVSPELVARDLGGAASVDDIGLVVLGVSCGQITGNRENERAAPSRLQWR